MFPFFHEKRRIAEKDSGAADMKTIGMIGGMSWESTVTYYRIINETIKRELGGFHSAKILLYSVWSTTPFLTSINSFRQPQMLWPHTHLQQT